jgi:inhibitor of KinA
MEYQLHPFAENSIIIDLGREISETSLQKIQTITACLDERSFSWMIEYVPAFTTITIYYDPIKVFALRSETMPYNYVVQEINTLLIKLKSGNLLQPRVISIPVCYGGDFGPDIHFVARYNNLTTREVIAIHSGTEYLVHMIGFAPGFPYIGGMSEKIAVPRRNTPRLKIPPGSVGIAGSQTGVYPIEPLTSRR